MARIGVLFTVIFLLFTFSYARFITVESEHDVTREETVTDLPKSDPTTATAILLPSERPGFEPAKVVDFKHDDASETDSDVGSVPLTKISFHPVNRHFPRRPWIPFRHKHNCRFHRRFRPLNPGFQEKRFISYGNDMILSDERSFDPESRSGVRQIQARWGSFPDDGTESKERVGFIKPHHHEHEHDHDHDHDHEHDHEDDHHHHHHHHHHQHRHHHHGEEEERDETEEHEHEGGFMRWFRKFFIHF